jgi:4-alpha-glucanotransferase
VQWIADGQLTACQQRARTRGLPVGLYLDVAVGVDANGADAWTEQAAILSQLSLGAPPDLYNPDGQNWGIAGFNPHGLANTDFKPFRRTIAAAMRHAGAIRIDLVLGLNRLFLIPHGAPAKDGVYFRFPLEAMLAVVAQESAASGCIVFGEDLGTVPDALRTTLADWGIWSYRVLMFERHTDGSFISPERYPRDALATFNTHDLPTYHGWITGHDLNVRRDVGCLSGETDEEREKARTALQAALVKAGCSRGGGFADVACYLAATPSRLALVAIEDVLGVIDQPNLPATIDEHPNWRQRLPLPLEDWGKHLQLHNLAQLFEDSGRAMSQPSTVALRKNEDRGAHESS